MHPQIATALNLWLITDRRWYKKSASLRSPETPVSLEPSSAIRLWASGLSGPMDSSANGTKWWLLDISRYFFVLWRAIWIVATPAERPVMCRYERAKVPGAVTSQARHFTDLHGTKVQPSGRLLSARRRPVGSFTAGTPALTKALWTKSFIAACLATLPLLRRHDKPCVPLACVHRLAAMAGM